MVDDDIGNRTDGACDYRQAGQACLDEYSGHRVATPGRQQEQVRRRIQRTRIVDRTQKPDRFASMPLCYGLERRRVRGRHPQ